MAGKEAVGTMDQDKLLEEALQVVKEQAFRMKRSIDGSRLMEGLKHASKMLCELRTSMLSPKSYYELYMAISDELGHLELFLVDQFQKGKKISDLYELVQYAGNIIPRLYLLVTVGAVYIKAKQIPVKDILKDLVEMCRGVQHPLRGLFLRNYLLQSIKRDLPESSDTESKDGCVDDSIDFVLLNFSEMNKLWVRMQHQGHSRNRVQREKERRELRILVGTNLVRLSSLEGVTPDAYMTKILPAIMEQIVSCKDPIAQEYLMECIIQVFPDENHLQTLDSFLGVCSQLHDGVNVKNIVISLIDRLAGYVARDGADVLPESLNLYTIFSEHVAQIIGNRPKMNPEDCVAMQWSLMNLARKCYPSNLEFIDSVFAAAVALMEERGLEKLSHSDAVSKELVKLTKFAVENFDSVATALGLANFSAMFSLFGFELRQELAQYMLRDVVTRNTQLGDLELVQTFLEVIAPTIADQEDQPKDEEVDMLDFMEEQSLVGRFVSLLHADAADTQYQIMSLTKKALSGGGPARLKVTMPGVVFQAFRLARRYHTAGEEDPLWEKKLKKIFGFCHTIISGLAKAEFHELALRLFLQAALTANRLAFSETESVAYEFWSQAITLFEEEITESTAQISAITLMVGSLESMVCFGEENFTALATQCTKVSMKLIKKPDQARGVLKCSHLFWSAKVTENSGEESRDGKQVLKCLSKAKKIANSCMEPLAKAAIFVEILNRAMLYYEWGAAEVSVDLVQEFVREVRESLEGIDAEEEPDVVGVKEYFANTLASIKLKQAASTGELSYQGGEF